MEMAKLGTTTGFFFTALNALSHSSAPKQINEAVRETVVLKTLQTTIHQQSCGPSWFLLRFAEGPAVRGFPSVVSGAVLLLPSLLSPGTGCELSLGLSSGNVSLWLCLAWSSARLYQFYSMCFHWLKSMAVFLNLLRYK